MEKYQRIEVTPTYIDNLMKQKNAINFIKENYMEIKSYKASWMKSFV